jgi:NADH-quinone oxidoreductase subunit M
VASTGVIFAAYYMLPMVQKVFFNKLEKDENRHVADVSGRELAILAPLVALMIWIGWNPTPFLQRMEPSVRAVIERVEGTASVDTPADRVAVDVDTPDAAPEPEEAD